MKSMVVIALSFVSVLAHANLVEDGSNFTGTFRAQEPACFVPAGTDVVGNPTPVRTDFEFKGSVSGITDDVGSTLSVSPMQIADHGGGMITGQSGQFLSSNEFVSEFLIITPNENGGQPTVTSDDYKIDGTGMLTHTTTKTVGRGNAQITRLCHFTRLN